MAKKTKKQDKVIDDICRCAFLVAFGDSEFSEDEEGSLGEVRAYCRNFIEARKAMQLLEETNDIKKARALYDSDMPLVHDGSSFFNTYLHDVQASLSETQDREGYMEVVDLYASRITEPYLQLVTAFAAERVAGADGDFNFLERQIFNRLFESWEITRQEYRYWSAKYAFALIFGHLFDPKLKLEDFEDVNDGDEISEAEIKSLLAKLCGFDSIEELEQKQTKIEDLPEIYRAVVANDVDLVSEALQGGADSNHRAEISGITGLTPLMLAAERSSLEIVTVLTEHGADVNAINDELGYTPLLWSLKGKNEGIAEFLIDRGANIEPFADRQADWSPLSMAAKKCLVDISKKLLATGANPNWRDPNGWVPLKHICNEPETDEAVDLVKLLLENKADPNMHDDDGFYPIHNAIDQGNVRITEKLLDSGVSIDLQFPDDCDEEGSLLKRACISVNPEILKLILDRLPDEKWVDNKKPDFLSYDDEGNPGLDDQDGFELIANTVRSGLNREADVWDVRESVALLCNSGVKPDLIGLCFAFLYPDIAETIIPFCEDELKDLLSRNPEMLLAFTMGLMQSVEDGARYFNSGPDLWFHAVKSMKACGIEVPDGLELTEDSEDDDELSPEEDAFIDLILQKVEENGADRVEALMHFITKVDEDGIDLKELLVGKNEIELEALAESTTKSLLEELETEDEDEDED